jgi:hypothetical protein
MSNFKLTVARIEFMPGEHEPQVRVTFEIDRAPIRFQVPVLLRVQDFDDSEMILAARNALHQMFADLAAQSRDWKLTIQDLRQLSSMSLRPKV